MEGRPFVTFELLPGQSLLSGRKSQKNTVLFTSLFLTIENSDQGGDNFAKSQYSAEMRKKA